MRMVPYVQCTAENRGCRTCPAGQYHDDMIGACMNCGSRCDVGFTSELSVDVYQGKRFSVCGPLISTSTLLYLLDNNNNNNNTTNGMHQQQQLLSIGCVSCPLLVGGIKVRYIAAGCIYMCYRDTTGENIEYDSYCASNVDPSSNGACSTFCKSCTGSIATMLSTSPPPHVGMYLNGCLDGIGYTWQDCDPASKPANSIWTASATVPGASKGCAWSCDLNTRPWNGQCLLCFEYRGGDAPCIAGQQLQYCDALKTHATCQPCYGPLPSEFQAWTSDAPYFSTCRQVVVVVVATIFHFCVCETSDPPPSLKKS